MKNKITIRQDHWGVALSVTREVYSEALYVSLRERWLKYEK